MGAAEILTFVCTVRDDPDRERKAIDGLLAKQVDGIIVTGRRVDPRPPINLGRSRTPVVYAYTQTTDPDTLCVVPDETRGAAIVTEHRSLNDPRNDSRPRSPNDLWNRTTPEEDLV